MDYAVPFRDKDFDFTRNGYKFWMGVAEDPFYITAQLVVEKVPGGGRYGSAANDGETWTVIARLQTEPTKVEKMTDEQKMKFRMDFLPIANAALEKWAKDNGSVVVDPITIKEFVPWLRNQFRNYTRYDSAANKLVFI